jgi:hypothetical protein
MPHVQVAQTPAHVKSLTEFRNKLTILTLCASLNKTDDIHSISEEILTDIENLRDNQWSDGYARGVESVNS